MTTSNTASLSSLGIGSGLDANSIVTQLVALQRQPIANLKTQVSAIQTKVSAYGQIQSAVASLQTAAQKLTNPATWSATTAASSDSTSVSASTSDGAVPGAYSVNVLSLAAPQSVVSKTTLASSTSLVGAGTLHIELGAWSGSAFTGKSGATPVDITISATDTLDDVRSKINSSNSGVTASIITDASGARLVMQSSTTGASNGFRTTGLSALAYDPGTATTGTTLTQAAGDASATVNGVAVTSATNTLSNVLSGISLTLNKVTTSPVAVTVAQDNTSITKAITDFATAYSSMSNLLLADTKYDAGSKTAGPLQGDSTAVGLQSQFRSLVGSTSNASSMYGTLSSIGLEIQASGALTVNTAKLTAALGNLGEVKKLFANSDSVDPSKNGLAVRFNTVASNMLAFDGAITTRTSGLNTSIQNNQKQQDVLDSRAVLYEKLLRAQYSALDKQMAALTSQGNYVTQQINAFNKG
ncbi:MAG: flagellar filament capping protein FliD [Burkholderiales bacterium]|nr:flagellar filament capping protein FliD [Burkholderiales bacterium]